MARGRRYLAAALVLALGVPAPTPAAPPGDRPVLDAAQLAARIDQLLAEQWAKAKVAPAAPAGDAEFLRRVYLDLTGTIPTVAEARAFLDDKRSDKRERLIDRLLAGHRYSQHFTNVWRALLLPDDTANIGLRIARPDFEAWLRKKLGENERYDQFVWDLLTATMPGGMAPNAAIRINSTGEPSPAAFYQAHENKPENLAAATSRLFLGVQLECAQCHDHPFAPYKREQFWQFAAFFASLPQNARQGDVVIAGRPNLTGQPEKRELPIPGTNKVAKAKFLDGTEPGWRSETPARNVLADWLTGSGNTFFARAAVNRLWAHCFGLGLVEPVDDLNPDNPASHPELFDELARQFVAHDYDLKYLLKAITLSRAYQLSSATESPPEPRLFARMAVKGLSPEQLFDTVAQATGYRESQPAGNRRALILGNGGPRDEFVSRFAQPTAKRVDAQTSILQALALMNGPIVGDATNVEKSETLGAVADAPFLALPQQVEALFLAALSRRPTEKEMERVAKYATERDPKRVLADVFWALLNSSEFALNH
jgi:hypothetical protein